MIYAVIIACEAAFGVFIVAGHVVRDVLCKRRLATVLLVLTRRGNRRRIRETEAHWVSKDSRHLLSDKVVIGASALR
ncbi:hypothetical protein RL72_00942 [Microbacterium azadirachtae]|uniref:Uncharacterized protein n=1 Tax=Microbacterium azadirachtae TaxID=582680 RepID=A0A0F0L2J9_9MICO|nr:hypothetical protein [Microbacterium azadirachtae]KJL26610.1 hypothetical protein RL72_00942 [Microbacterium azadirachtae]